MECENRLKAWVFLSENIPKIGHLNAYFQLKLRTAKLCPERKAISLYISTIRLQDTFTLHHYNVYVGSGTNEAQITKSVQTLVQNIYTLVRTGVQCKLPDVQSAK
jgi:hypothetical protein